MIWRTMEIIFDTLLFTLCFLSVFNILPDWLGCGIGLGLTMSLLLNDLDLKGEK